MDRRPNESCYRLCSRGEVGPLSYGHYFLHYFWSSFVDDLSSHSQASPLLFTWNLHASTNKRMQCTHACMRAFAGTKGRQIMQTHRRRILLTSYSSVLVKMSIRRSGTKYSPTNSPSSSSRRTFEILTIFSLRSLSWPIGTLLIRYPLVYACQDHRCPSISKDEMTCEVVE